MHLSKLFVLALTGFGSFVLAALEEAEGFKAEVIEGDLPADFSGRDINVDVKATLPEASLLGIKIFNGRPTKSLVTFTNNEEKPINVLIVGGSLWTEGVNTQPIRNLTSSRYEAEVAPGESKNVDYTFSTDMHPQDVSLIIATMVSMDGQFYQLQALNQTVSVVDEATSIFDPQILFLYLVLLGSFVGVGYLVYATWVAPMFPAKSKRRFDVKQQKKEPVPESTTTGAYDESWIPEHHLRKPEIKRSRSGTPSTKAKTRT